MIYFLQNGDPTLVKIGYSNKPSRRRGDLQTGSPTKLHDMIPPIQGSDKRETWIHRKFDHLRLRRDAEWFRLEDDLRDFIFRFKDGDKPNEDLPLLTFIELAEIQEERVAIQVEIEAIEAEKARLEAENADLEAKVARLAAELATIEAERESIEAKLAADVAKGIELEAKLEESRIKLVTMRDDIESQIHDLSTEDFWQFITILVGTDYARNQSDNARV